MIAQRRVGGEGGIVSANRRVECAEVPRGERVVRRMWNWRGGDYPMFPALDRSEGPVFG